MNSAMTMTLGLLGLFSVPSPITALPQSQASVTLLELGPVSIIGTEWAQPIGTATDGSATTFIFENVATFTGLTLNGGSTVVSTATETAIQTVVVSASGWAQSNFPTTTPAGSTQLGGEIDCHFSSSTSVECVEEEVLGDGSTATRTLSGDAATFVLPISTGTLPSTQSTSSAASTTSSKQQITVTNTVPSTPSSNSGSASTPSSSNSGSASTAASPSTSSNAAVSTRGGGEGGRGMMLTAVIGTVLGGMMFGI